MPSEGMGEGMTIQTDRPAPRVVEAGGSRIELFVDDRIAPDARALDQLAALSRLPHVVSPVVAMPDIHSKGRNPAPTGIVVAVEGGVVPLALDAGLNCGMRVHVLDAVADELSEERLRQLFAALSEAVPTGWWPEPVLSDPELEGVLRTGAAWVVDRRDGRGGPVARIENGGAIPDPSPREVLTGRVRRRALRGLGVLGAGNHFLELHVVDSVLHEHAAALGLEEGRLLAILHSGSGVVGKNLGLYFGERDELHGRRKRQTRAEKLVYHLSAPGPRGARLQHFRKEFAWLAADSVEGRRFLRAVAVAANYGYANRAAIGAALEQAVARTLGPSVGAPLLYDVSHVLVQREQHAGRDLFVHRHGASRAFPPSLMRASGADALFAVTGQPFPVPGSMGDHSYICVGSEGAATTYFSANHGAGRTLDKPQAREAFTADAVREQLSDRGIALYQHGADLGLAEQAPGAFKDVAAVIDVMQRLDVAVPVARTTPIATMKG